MSTHDTAHDTEHDTGDQADESREIDHADENYGVDSEGDEVAQEQAAEAEEAEPVEGDLAPEAVTDADVDDEAGAIALGPVGTDETDPGVGGVVTAEQPGDVEGSTELDELAAEPVVVDLDESDVEVLDEPGDDTDDTVVDDEDGGSVLLTESEPGSVLPPEEPEGPERTEQTEEPAEPDEAVEPVQPVVAADVDEPMAAEEPEEPEEPEPSAAALLEPVGADAALDPGSGTYQERWSAIQGAFVDEPLRAVESAGALVAQMWQDFQRSMTEQREALDGGWADDSPTDDLRDAFKRYRLMFTQLTALMEAQGPG